MLYHSDEKRSYVTRFKKWKFHKNASCGGEWIHNVCNFGYADMERLQQSKHLFANKIRLEDEPELFHELEVWYRRRSSPDGAAETAKQFDVSYYSKVKFVNKHLN